LSVKQESWNRKYSKHFLENTNNKKQTVIVDQKVKKNKERIFVFLSVVCHVLSIWMKKIWNFQRNSKFWCTFC